MGNYRTNVEKGAAFLDERMPGWIDSVDVRKLDLGSCFTCVLGQLGGHYSELRLQLGVSRDDAIEYGFNVPEMDNQVDEDLSYGALTEEWQAYIEEAREGRSS